MVLSSKIPISLKTFAKVDLISDLIAKRSTMTILLCVHTAQLVVYLYHYVPACSQVDG